MPARERRVTIVIVTRNRISHLITTLKQLTSLPEKPAVIVVDNHSSDGTAVYLRRYCPGVELLEMKKNLGAAARTEGALRAKTPYIAFCDDDSWWAQGALTKAADILDAHPSLALLCGRVLVGERRLPDPVCGELENSAMNGGHDLPGKAILGFICCGAVLRRNAFLETGGFNRHFLVGGEEALLALDLVQRGWHLAYVKEVTACHYPAGIPGRGDRGRIMQRNALWTIWLRMPWRSLVPMTLRHLHLALRSPQDRAAFFAALKGLPWVLRRRRPVSQKIAQAFMNVRN